MQKIKISESESGLRIDKICADRFPEHSRTRWQKNGVFEKLQKKFAGKTKVISGEIWLVGIENFPENLDTKKPYFQNFRILAESKSWVAIEKPAGISVHASGSEKTEKTVANALFWAWKEKQKFASPEPPRLVHRLDKPTSGVLLAAKTESAHQFLQRNWTKCEKIYFAICSGVLPEKGKISGGICRDQKDRTRMQVLDLENAKWAETLFWREQKENSKNLNQVKIQILTGRTHQIRAHFAAIGCPILGDRKYGGDDSSRLFLHAHSLAFPDPDQSGEMVRVLSDLPDEFYLEGENF